LPADLCWTIIKDDIKNIEHIQYPTKEMCMYCIDDNEDIIKIIKNIPVELHDYVVSKNSLYITNILNPTLKQYINAYRNNRNVFYSLNI
jgi:hypothetical protein